jgi:hypothetical protein
MIFLQKKVFTLMAILIGLNMAFSSCKSKKNALSQSEETMNTNENINENVDKAYHLVLSFYSIGSGADWDIIAEYDRFIEIDKASSTQKANIDRVTWGREGEVDFCIDLSNLTNIDKETFIKQSKEIAQKAKYVHINENAPCRNKR